jgi:hypothetical protein
VTLAREPQSSKQQLSSVSKAAGMQIDARLEQHQKAYGPMHESLEPNANAMVEREQQPESAL